MRLKFWGLVILVLLVGGLQGGKAWAQASVEGLSGADIRNGILNNCASNLDHPICSATKDNCMKGTHADPSLCRQMGWTPEQYAAKQISKLKDQCDSENFDTGCVAIRTSCREEGATCEQVKQIACKDGGRCDEEYLCTPSRLKSVCSGANDLGASHMLMGASAAKLESDFGDQILGGFAVGHGQTGSPGLSTNYALEMNLGWYKGSDDNGMSYELQILIGGGSRTGSFMFGAAGGGGFGGIASGPLGFGWLVSAEAFAQASVAGGLEVLAYVRPSWVFSEDPRSDGSDLAPFADELNVGVTLSWIDKHKEGNFVAGTGYGLLLFYKEQLGFNMVGIGIGSAISDVSQ